MIEQRQTVNLARKLTTTGCATVSAHRYLYMGLQRARSRGKTDKAAVNVNMQCLELQSKSLVRDWA